jgi:hypothetical protein
MIFATVAALPELRLCSVTGSRNLRSPSSIAAIGNQEPTGSKVVNISSKRVPAIDQEPVLGSSTPQWTFVQAFSTKPLYAGKQWIVAVIGS